MQEEIYNFYSQAGGSGAASMPVFVGARRPGMLGGGFFSTLARYALPILRNIGGRFLRVAARTARDVLGNQRSLGDALLQHTSREVADVARSPSPPSNINKQQGTGFRKRRRALDIFTKLKRQRQK
jgi:hypothetical protein